MAKEIMFGGWVSIVPNKMILSGTKRKFINSRKLSRVNEIDATEKHGDVAHIFSLLNNEGYVSNYKWYKTKQEIKDCLRLGYRNDKHSIIVLNTKIYNIMHQEVHDWYKQVFDYIEDWLLRNNLLHIEKGGLQTGFCVESDLNNEVVKDWGAPLAKENNKVAQMKEKFGFFTVYFYSLTDKDDKKIKKFAKEVEKKFDCRTLFC